MKPMNILLGSACVAALTNGAIAGIWLNELHYDNAGQDVGEAVEIAADFVIDPELLEVAHTTATAPFTSQRAVSKSTSRRRKCGGDQSGHTKWWARRIVVLYDMW